jgi:hypothetical protein
MQPHLQQDFSSVYGWINGKTGYGTLYNGMELSLGTHWRN